MHIGTFHLFVIVLTKLHTHNLTTLSYVSNTKPAIHLTKRDFNYLVDRDAFPNAPKNDPLRDFFPIPLLHVSIRLLRTAGRLIKRYILFLSVVFHFTFNTFYFSIFYADIF